MQSSAANPPRPSPRAIGLSRGLDQIAAPDATRRPGAGIDVAQRVAALSTLDLGELRQEWRRLFQSNPPRLSRDLMMRAIAYGLQAVAHGGLSKATERRLVSLAAELETDGQIAAPAEPRIKAGSRLVREWHGRIYTVAVTENGFDLHGKSYRSLTTIAREITGAHWSGPRFFGLAKSKMTTTNALAAPTMEDGDV